MSAEATGRAGTRMGDYDLKSVIGAGGTGVVYRGRHVASNKPVAIKLLHDNCARMKNAVEQLINEARATSRIHHPSMVDVTDVGTAPDGTVFLAMEYLEGESLRDRLHRVSRLPLFEAINILRQVARGLGAAHEAGLVHAVLQPSAIFLCKREGRRRIVRRSRAKGMRLVVEPEESFDLVKLLDFGMAGFLDLSLGAQTRTGAVCGMPHYLSPEQAQMQPADPRSDIYSLGAIFYEMVTGNVPFAGETLSDVFRGQVSGLVIAPSRRTPGVGIDTHIDSLILRCLKTKPLLRFATTSELCVALDACITDCAFLRDAHRLPGILESGIDLSDASPQARQDGARPAEKPAPAPVAEKPAMAPAMAPVVAKLATAPVAKTPAIASAVAKPVAAPSVDKPAALPVVAKPSAPPVEVKPEMAPAAQAPVQVPMMDDPAATVITPPPTILPPAEDPAAGVITPPPTLVTIAHDPAAEVRTPPPVVVAPSLPAELTTGSAEQPTPRERPESIVADIEERPARFDLESGSRRPQAFALVGLLILVGGGIALWAALSDSGQSTPQPLVPSQTAAAPTPAPSPLPPAPAPVAAPTPPVAPAAAAPVAAPAPPVAPPAAAPTAAPPEPEPATHAETARATTKVKSPGPGKPASHSPRPAHGARPKSSKIAVPSETAPASAVESEAEPAESETAPAAKPESQPESRPSAPSPTAAEPEPAPPAPPTVDELVHEAQRAWMRGHYAVAIGKAQAALKAEPNRAQAVQAYEIIGTCSCSLRDADGAREAASHLGDTKRELVKAVCQKNGVPLE